MESAEDVLVDPAATGELTGFFTLFIREVIPTVSIEMVRVGIPGYGGMMASQEDVAAAATPTEVGRRAGWNVYDAK